MTNPSYPIASQLSSRADAPIFIVGVHRSGTTLLRFMLSSSPRIYIPPESDFIPRFFRRAPDRPLSEDQAARILRKIWQYRFVKEWQGDPPRAADLLQDGRTPAAFLHALYTTYASQYGAVRWGDKTPIYTSYIPLLHHLFPTARFVHVIRDGRDVALSTLDKWGSKEFHVDIYYAARNWVRRVRQAREGGARLGKHLYYELHYEQLVQQPEQELQKLCHFLGEEYLPQMAHQDRLARQWIKPGGFHDPVRRPPNAGRVDRWRREMSPRDLRLFQRVAGDLLLELGYETTDPEPTPPSEAVRFAYLSAKYISSQVGRHILQALGVLPPI